MDATFDQKFKELEAQHAQGVVVGLEKLTGVAPRLDIDVFIDKNPEAFNLMLIAFDELHNAKRSDIMGFFQIAGIHGFPIEPWHGIKGRLGAPGEPGYCAHSITTFPTWHRPYLVMLEQALFIQMVNLANKYDEPHRSKYREAVYSFRLPYWDYHRPRGGRCRFPGVIKQDKDNRSFTEYKYNFMVPLVFTVETIKVRQAPDDKEVVLDPNPLYTHQFKEETGQLDEEKEWKKIDDEGKETGVSRSQTHRHPYGGNLHNVGRMNGLINELRMDTARLAVTLVTDPLYANYEIFSNTKDRISKPVPDGSTDRDIEAWLRGFDGPNRRVGRGSLESIHNMYHVCLGGFARVAGHVGYVPVAAFDPLFWFHHNNIERMFTVWQAINGSNPDCWFNFGKSLKESEAPLLPFLSRPKSSTEDKADFWTSDSAKDARKLGYYYSECGDKNKDLPGSQIAQNYKEKYAWSIPQKPGEEIGDPPAGMEWIDIAATRFLKGQETHLAPPAATAMSFMALEPAINEDEELELALAPMSLKLDQAGFQEDAIWDWYIDDKVEALALGGAFTIPYFVLNDPQAGLSATMDLARAPDLVGVTHIFTSPIETCANCDDKAKDRTVVRNTMFITSQLHDYVKTGALQSLDPEHVVPFLKERLRWRAVKASGEQIDPRNLSQNHQLRVGVSSRKTIGGDPTTVEYSTPDQYKEIIDYIIHNASPQATFADQGTQTD